VLLDAQCSQYRLPAVVLALACGWGGRHLEWLPHLALPLPPPPAVVLALVKPARPGSAPSLARGVRCVWSFRCRSPIKNGGDSARRIVLVDAQEPITNSNGSKSAVPHNRPVSLDNYHNPTIHRGRGGGGGTISGRPFSARPPPHPPRPPRPSRHLAPPRCGQRPARTIPTPQECYAGTGNIFYRESSQWIFLGPREQFLGVGIAGGGDRVAAAGGVEGLNCRVGAVQTTGEPL
jgi:hypothetical protein